MAGCWHRLRSLSRRTESRSFGKIIKSIKIGTKKSLSFWFRSFLSALLGEVEADRVHDPRAAVPEVVHGAHDGELAARDTVRDQAGALGQES